jgi:hypothetical protein
VEGTPEGYTWLVGTVVSLLVGGIAFFGMRCPSCGVSLESSRPKACRKCGLRLFVN